MCCIEVLSRPSAFGALEKLFLELQLLISSSTTGNEELNAGLTEIDYEERTAGYEIAYSRLGAPELAGVDPDASVKDPPEFFDRGLGATKCEAIRCSSCECVIGADADWVRMQVKAQVQVGEDPAAGAERGGRGRVNLLMRSLKGTS